MADIIAETERLVLRHWREEDRIPFAEMNADPEVMKYFQAEMSREESDALVDRIEAHFGRHGFGLFALERKRDGVFLGFTGFMTCAPGSPVEGEIEIGWRLAKDFWRKGFAFEAASACLDWFWRNTGHPRLVSFTSDLNHPSRALMQKLGFAHRPDLDFDHPNIAADDPLCHQVVYVLDREDRLRG